ncbi:chymotrypsin family serine protease [Peterkaempfera griseoplana]|uniref:hypothetical protein n=1 Tax=Peterkaempfera griseoplana TaxID=66896 RepID=UPI0012FEE88E|nr:hypothetical protein [Peterkaempfera griseoplana]
MAQIPLDAAAEKIHNAAAKPGTGHNGLVNTRVDADHHTVTVYWHGAVPPDVARLVRRLRRTVSVTVVPARYDKEHLKAAVRRGLRMSGAVSGYPLVDGSGIQLDFAGHAAAPRAVSLNAELAVAVHTGHGGGPVTLQATCVFTGAPVLGAPSRCDDQPNYWGGNVIRNATTGDGCSTAFGMHDSSGRTYMATAAHCSENLSGTPVNGITFTNGDLTHSLGQSLDVPGSHDAALIAAPAGNEYYDGPGILHGDTHNAKRVVGQQHVSVGDWLCESGAFGGVICGIQVEATNVSPANDPWSDLVMATTGGTYTVGGDSGGPYFSLDGSSTVWARGIHEGLGKDSSGRTVEYFTDIYTLTNDTGATVNT